jgi:hypothetical protein
MRTFFFLFSIYFLLCRTEQQQRQAKMPALLSVCSLNFQICAAVLNEPANLKEGERHKRTRDAFQRRITLKMICNYIGKKIEGFEMQSWCCEAAGRRRSEILPTSSRD